MGAFMKLILILLAVIFALATAGSLLDVLTIESRPGATILQQMVARVTFGFSALLFVTCAGFAAVLARMDSNAGLRATVNDIAMSNADAAKTLAALRPSHGSGSSVLTAEPTHRP